MHATGEQCRSVVGALIYHPILLLNCWCEDSQLFGILFVDISSFEFWLLLPLRSLHEHIAVIVGETLQFASWQWRLSCKLTTAELLGCWNTLDCSNCTVQGSCWNIHGHCFVTNSFSMRFIFFHTIQSDTSASGSREENYHELSPKENFLRASFLYCYRDVHILFSPVT